MMTNGDNALVLWFTDEEWKDLQDAAQEHGWDLKEHARDLLLDHIAS
jgi:hypothetical protein